MSLSDSQTFLLPDGRLLGYAEYGAPNGFPLLFFHGFPSSRLEARGLDKIARRHRLRIIALDRPGFGLSTFQPRRRITDWPLDAQDFARNIHLKRFAILAGSGGCPYALACARALPKEMLAAVGIMSGAGPWESGTQRVPWSAWLTHLAATYCPLGLKLATDALVGILRWTVTTGPVTRWIDNWLAALKKDVDEGQDTEEKSTPSERRERLLRIGFEAFSQGAGGFVCEAQLLSQRDWGFRFEDITYDSIKLWHGTEDKSAPVQMVRYMADRLPHSVLREFEGEGHFAIVKHLDEVISDLIPDGESLPVD